MQYDNYFCTFHQIATSEIRDKKRLESTELCFIRTVVYPLSHPRRKDLMIPVIDITKQKPSIIWGCQMLLFPFCSYFGLFWRWWERNPVRAHPFNTFFPISSACNIEVNEKPGFMLQNSQDTDTLSKHILPSVQENLVFKCVNMTMEF
jgi:hypothetical protein